ncbi:hypothetical protein HDU96_011092, partial [Phlyctochytrium bullatum]
EVLHSRMQPLLGDGIFVADGHHWKWQPKVSSHIFTGRNFREVVQRVVLEVMEKLLAVLSATADSGKQIDLYELIHCAIMDSTYTNLIRLPCNHAVSVKSVFGIRLNTLDDPTNSPDFVQGFDALAPIINMRFINALHSITEPLNGDAAKILRSMKAVDEVVYAQIRRKREELEASGDGMSKTADTDLIDLFMAYDDGITDPQLRDMVLNMVLAGRDTTAQSLSWCIYTLTLRPDIVAKMREEISRTVGDALPTYDKVSGMKYITAVFYETLRLYPSVRWNTKVSVKDDVLPGGIHIPAGTEINWHPYCMGRLQEVWGPDAKEFRPERWFDRESQFKWSAFNAGPRVCLGQQLATVEAVIALVGMVKSLDFKVVEGAVVTPGLGIALVMANGLPVTIQKVKA